MVVIAVVLFQSRLLASNLEKVLDLRKPIPKVRFKDGNLLVERRMRKRLRKAWRAASRMGHIQPVRFEVITLDRGIFREPEYLSGIVSGIVWRGGTRLGIDEAVMSGGIRVFQVIGAVFHSRYSGGWP